MTGVAAQHPITVTGLLTVAEADIAPHRLLGKVGWVPDGQLSDGLHLKPTLAFGNAWSQPD